MTVQPVDVATRRPPTPSSNIPDVPNEPLPSFNAPVLYLPVADTSNKDLARRLAIAERILAKSQYYEVP